MSLFGIKIIELFDPELAKVVDDGFKNIVDVLMSIKKNIGYDEKMIAVLEQLHIFLEQNTALMKPNLYSNNTNAAEISNFDANDYKIEMEVYAAELYNNSWNASENNIARLKLALKYHNINEIKNVLSNMSYNELFETNGGFTEIIAYIQNHTYDFEYVKKDAIKAMGLTCNPFYSKICYEKIGDFHEILVEGFLWSPILKRELMLYILNMHFENNNHFGNSLMEFAIAAKYDNNDVPFDTMIILFKELFVEYIHEVDIEIMELFISDFSSDGFQKDMWWENANFYIKINKKNIKLLSTLKKYKVPFTISTRT